MRAAASRLREFRRNQRGVTVVEFAFVAPTLMVLLLGTLDLGYRIYAASVVQGVVQAAARKATVGDMTSDQIDAYVKAQLANFTKDPLILKKAYADFTNVQQLEKITSDTAPIGVYNAGYMKADGTIVGGDCYDDVNNDFKRDDMGTTGLGNSDQIVYYKVTVSWPSFLPMRGLLGWSDQESVSANTVLRNQPYSANSDITPPNRCYEK